VIIGARNPAQLEQTLTAIKEEPLGEETVVRVEHVWEMCRGEAPRDNWVDYLARKA